MRRHLRGFTGMFVLFATVTFGAQSRQHDPTWVVPADQAGRTNPLGGRPDAAAGGRKLFQQRCASCHGDTGQGTAKAPDLTSPDVQLEPDGALYWKISHGNTRSGMPSFSFFPEVQRWQLVLHMRSLVAVHPQP